MWQHQNQNAKKNTEENSHRNNDNKPKTAQNLEKETEEIITMKQN
jgi:hypothetical protein